MNKLKESLQTFGNKSHFQLFHQRISHLSVSQRVGFVTEVIMTQVHVCLPEVMQGELCVIDSADGESILAEVIAFDDIRATLSCLEPNVGVSLGARVTPLGRQHCVKPSEHLLGSIFDGMGRNFNNPKLIYQNVMSLDIDAVPVMRDAPNATNRPPVDTPFETSISIIDTCLTMGVGQRIGIFAPPGCGKSTLMAQIVRGCRAERVVFGLVGERGKELREFIENEIDDEIRKRCYFVCSTSDRSPIERVRCAFTATSIAEFLRDEGMSVLLVIDSLTRLARAQREIGLMAGEPTTQSGFTPSTFSVLPQLVERAGRTMNGSITAVYTVLMEREKLEEDPIANEAKSLLDGHIVLSGKLVERGHFPAIDLQKSLSRVMGSVASHRKKRLTQLVRRAYSFFEEIELLLRINEYKIGTDSLIDEAIRIKPSLDSWSMQNRRDLVSADQSEADLEQIIRQFERLITQ